MSDFSPTEATTEGLVDSTPEVEAQAEPVEVDEAPQRQYVSDDLNEHYVKFKVDGEDVELPLSEALQGVMRQQDYTRKTQGVAAERERLQRAEAVFTALERDPSATIQALNEVYGLQEEDADDSDLDPVEARFARLERAEQDRQQQSQIQAIESEMSELHVTHGDFDEDALVNHAVQYNLPNLEVAYAHMTMRQQAVDAAEAAKRQRVEAATKAKREAAVVEGGAHRQGVARVASSKPSLREAWQAAKQSVG